MDNIMPEQPDNKWNPFIPTQRDIQRTDELAAKNVAVAGILTFLFAPAGLIYLNRGVNALKIIGYVFAASFAIALIVQPKEDSDSNSIGQLVGSIGGIAMTAEQIIAVNKAQQRLQKKDIIEIIKQKNNDFINAEQQKLSTSSHIANVNSTKFISDSELKRILPGIFGE